MPSKRTGTPGLDVFKIAGNSISGYLPGFKTGDNRHVRVPYTTLLEQRLAMYLEYHPHVRSYQRGDASEAFVQAHHIAAPLGTPYSIGYTYEGKAHEYLPDFVGTLCDGGLLIAEAGREVEKSQGRAVAKAEAARQLAQLKGGAYWLGTDENLSACRHHNLMYLHTRRRSFPSFQEIAATLLAHWPWGEIRTVDELLLLFGSQWSEGEVEAAVWKLAGDAAAAGRLLVDLSTMVFDHTTPLAFLDPAFPPILPDPLPSSVVSQPESNESVCLEERQQLILELPQTLPGPTFDASVLETPELRSHFHRNLNAVMDVLGGKSQGQVARSYGMASATLCRLVKRAREFGQIACVPHGTYQRDRDFHPDFGPVIRKLYCHPLRPTVKAIQENVQLKQLATMLSEREGKAVLVPTYWQIYCFTKTLHQEAPVLAARSGLKHSPRERMSPQSFVLSIPFPAYICQVDEHSIDLHVVTSDGIVVTQRVHAAVLICVKTAAILGAVVALDSLTEEDYMRLVKQAIEPKDRLTALYECKHPWPCSGKPAIIFHDRGKIFTSERATQVLVDRLGIVTEQAPPYAPSAKGTVEALFTWITRKVIHRLPGTTKATPKDRGIYDSLSEAKKAGITLDVLEKWLIQAIVDAYMQEWDGLRRQKRSLLWQESVQRMGVNHWLGSQDDLKLLLMKSVNRKNLATGHYAIHHGALSFLGRRYVSPGLLDRLRGKEIDIYYDRRDISVIYLFLDGILVGEAYCTEFMGRRVSIWEAQAERRADGAASQEAATESLATRQAIQQEATSGRRVLSLEIKRLERKRHLDHQRADIHPAQVQATLQALTSSSPLASPPKFQLAGLLPPAVPNDIPGGREGVRLPVRKLNKDDE